MELERHICKPKTKEVKWKGTRSRPLKSAQKHWEKMIKEGK